MNLWVINYDSWVTFNYDFMARLKSHFKIRNRCYVLKVSDSIFPKLDSDKILTLRMDIPNDLPRNFASLRSPYSNAHILCRISYHFEYHVICRIWYSKYLTCNQIISFSFLLVFNTSYCCYLFGTWRFSTRISSISFSVDWLSRTFECDESIPAELCTFFNFNYLLMRFLFYILRLN